MKSVLKKGMFLKISTALVGIMVMLSAVGCSMYCGVKQDEQNKMTAYADSHNYNERSAEVGASGGTTASEIYEFYTENGTEEEAEAVKEIANKTKTVQDVGAGVAIAGVAAAGVAALSGVVVGEVVGSKRRAQNHDYTITH